MKGGLPTPSGGVPTAMKTTAAMPKAPPTASMIQTQPTEDDAGLPPALVSSLDEAPTISIQANDFVSSKTKQQCDIMQRNFLENYPVGSLTPELAKQNGEILRGLGETMGCTGYGEFLTKYYADTRKNNVSTKELQQTERDMSAVNKNMTDLNKIRKDLNAIKKNDSRQDAADQEFNQQIESLVNQVQQNTEKLSNQVTEKAAQVVQAAAPPMATVPPPPMGIAPPSMSAPAPAVVPPPPMGIAPPPMGVPAAVPPPPAMAPPVVTARAKAPGTPGKKKRSAATPKPRQPNPRDELLSAIRGGRRLRKTTATAPTGPQDDPNRPGCRVGETDEKCRFRKYSESVRDDDDDDDEDDWSD